MNILYALFFTLILSCSESSSSAGGTATETETSISAIVRDGENVSSQTKVYLYEIERLSLQEKLVDSMYTDENGRFSFSTEKGGVHRVEVQKGNRKANFDAVSGTNSQVKEVYLRSTFVVKGLIKECAGAQIYTQGGIPVVLDEFGLFTLTEVASGNNMLILEKAGSRAVIPLLFQSTRDTLYLFDLKIGNNKYKFDESYPLLEPEKYDVPPVHYYSKIFEGVFYLGNKENLQSAPNQIFYTLVADSNYAKSLSGNNFKQEFPKMMKDIVLRASGYIQNVRTITKKYSFRLKNQIVWTDEITDQALLKTNIKGDHLVINPNRNVLSEVKGRLSLNLDLQNHLDLQKADSLAKLFLYQFTLDLGAYPRAKFVAKTLGPPYGLDVTDTEVNGDYVDFFYVMYDYKANRFHPWTEHLLNKADSNTSRDFWKKEYLENHVNSVDLVSLLGDAFEAEVFGRALGSNEMTLIKSYSFIGARGVVDIPELTDDNGFLKWEMLVIRMFSNGFSAWNELYMSEIIGSCWTEVEGCKDDKTGKVTMRPEFTFR